LRGISPLTVAGRRLARVGELFRLDEPAMELAAMSFSAISAEHRTSLFAPGVKAAVANGEGHEALRESLVRDRRRHPVERMIGLELSGFLPDHNLNYTDKMAMLAGVEVRVPFADPSIVEFAAAVPLDEKIDLRHTKKILRRSQAARLPAEILARPKQGFGVPARAWLHGAARPLLEELTGEAAVQARGLFDAGAVASLRRNVLAGRIDAAWTFFPLMAIELWCRALDAAPVAAMDAEAPAEVPRLSGTG
jgi:asparagine synthase (glutamine-hydrolysing)